jgi:hypothetical protein
MRPTSTPDDLAIPRLGHVDRAASVVAMIGLDVYEAVLRGQRRIEVQTRADINGHRFPESDEVRNIRLHVAREVGL